MLPPSRVRQDPRSIPAQSSTRRREACRRCSVARPCRRCFVTARVESRDSRRNVDVVVAEGGAMGQVEDGLFGRGRQHRPQLGADPFGVQAVGVALDETDDGRPIGQRDGAVLAPCEPS